MIHRGLGDVEEREDVRNGSNSRTVRLPFRSDRELSEFTGPLRCTTYTVLNKIGEVKIFTSSKE